MTVLDLIAAAGAARMVADQAAREAVAAGDKADSARIARSLWRYAERDARDAERQARELRALADREKRDYEVARAGAQREGWRARAQALAHESQRAEARAQEAEQAVREARDRALATRVASVP